MDLRMPVMDGQTAIRQIRQREQGAQAAVPENGSPPAYKNRGGQRWHADLPFRTDGGPGLQRFFCPSPSSKRTSARCWSGSWGFSSSDFVPRHRRAACLTRPETATTRLTTAALQTLPEGLAATLSSGPHPPGSGSNAQSWPLILRQNMATWLPP